MTKREFVFDNDGEVHQFEGIADFLQAIRNGEWIGDREFLIGVTIEDDCDWWIVENIQEGKLALRRYYNVRQESWRSMQVYQPVGRILFADSVF